MSSDETAPARPVAPPVLPRLGRYQARKLLGSGASGTVYSAIDTETGRKAALKVLRDSLDMKGETRERFLREARLAAGVSSPYVVEYRDAGSENGVLYLVTELLASGDAHRLLERYPQGMPVIMAATIVRDCARGLAAIHEAGLIHRDVKPSNIFLGSTGVGKLGDLGLARSSGSAGELTAHGDLVGTPDFMAPEQAMAGEGIDHRADIYALAASFFHLLTKRPPHQGDTAWAVLAQLINDPFPDPRSIRPDLSPAVARVVMKAGAKDPDLRYADAMAFASDLDAVIAGREPSATDPPPQRQGTTRLAKPSMVATPRIVLLVDDDPIIRRLYRARLEQDGFTVLTAAQGDEAVERAKKVRPHIILLDLMLGSGDGLAALARMRALPGFDSVPTVLFSSSFTESRLEEARRLGVVEVLAKANCSPRQVSDLLVAHIVRTTAAPPVESIRPPSRDEPLPSGLMQLAETTLLRLRLLLARLGRGDGAEADRLVLAELAATAHGLAAAAGTVRAQRTALLAEAAEHLARQLLEHPERLTPSCLRTIGQALIGLREALPHLMERAPLPALHAVVVDDDAIALDLSCRALGKAGIATTRFTDPLAALERLAESPADLVVTDVMMGGLNGVQLATRMRGLPQHRQTPILFVTGLADFAERLAHVEDPRMDVIAKPILLGELAVKALTQVFATAPS